MSEHFAKCMRLWEAMLPRRNSDELAGELLAEGYFMMLGHLSDGEMTALTEMVLDRCKWFPSVAECKEIMAEPVYGNPFYAEKERKRLAANGYGTPIALPASRPQLNPGEKG